MLLEGVADESQARRKERTLARSQAIEAHDCGVCTGGSRRSSTAVGPRSEEESVVGLQPWAGDDPHVWQN